MKERGYEIVFLISFLFAVSVFIINNDFSFFNFLKDQNIDFGTKTEIKNENTGNMGLYKMKVGNENLYVSLDIEENPSYEENIEIQKLHTNVFWDPKKCSQMQVSLGKEKIVFVDSFIESQGNPGFSAFIFIYDVKENKLVQYESPISINKIYKTEEGDNFYVISKVKDSGNNYNLYKVDLPNRKFIFVKSYEQPEGYGLITATKTLLWCANFGKDCVGDQEFPFQKGDELIRIEKDVDNVFGVRVLWENKAIFELKSSDLVRSFILGVI